MEQDARGGVEEGGPLFRRLLASRVEEFPGLGPVRRSIHRSLGLRPPAPEAWLTPIDAVEAAIEAGSASASLQPVHQQRIRVRLTYKVVVFHSSADAQSAAGQRLGRPADGVSMAEPGAILAR